MATQFGEPDIYGQVHPIESPELIECRLKELDEALSSLASTPKGAAYTQALTNCPSLLHRSFKLLFLRARKFDARQAAERILRYWEHRIDIFEDDRAFMPLTLKGALREDSATISKGVICPTGCQDSDGREIVFFDPSRQDREAYTRKSLARVMWYALHTALESESAQQKGVVFVNYAKEVSLSQVDRGLVKLVAPTISGSLPIRLAAMHVCYPPSFFAIIFPIISFFLGPKIRKRVQLHAANVLEELAAVGLPSESLPTQVGGELELNLDRWIETRMAIEG